MSIRILASSMMALTLLIPATLGLAADAGVSARKLVILDKGSKAKLVYVSKNEPGIEKGAAGDPALLSGTFVWGYETDEASSVSGSFVGFTAHWITNTDKVAKWVDKFGGVKTVVIKPGRLAKFVAPLIGVSGQGNLFDGAPTASDGILTVLTIENGNDASTHRMCTRFATDAGSTVIYRVILQGEGIKIVGRNGVPAACP